MSMDRTSTKPEVTFLFRRPDSEPSLSTAANVAIGMGALASRLVLEERTLCDHADGRAENVSEHENMLAKVAPALVAELYPLLDTGLVSLFANLHDDIEAWVGDTPTHDISDADREAKAAREAEGLERAREEYADVPFFADLLERYEAQREPEARAVRVIDKMMVLLIHLPNNGATLRSYHTYESFMRKSAEHNARLRAEYLDFEELILIREELCQHLADSFLFDLHEQS